VPVIVKDVPIAATEGEKPEIVGAPGLPTTNAAVLVADPAVVVTVIVPVVLPEGTVATS